MKRQSFFILLALITGLIFTLNGVSALCAQETKADEFTLEEITVTAQKRVENQQKVAIAMETISGEDLTATGKTNVDDILANISNVIINNSPDGMRVSVRGISDTDSPFHDMNVSTPTVAINIDGAYNKASSAGMNLFDVERVEVLMGPQSTLYANTSPGGIVNVVTAAPKTDKFSASATIEAGNFKHFNAQAMLNAPIITEKLAMRLAANWDKRDPFIDATDQTGQNTKTARLKTLFQPSEKFSATVSLNWAKKIGGGMMGGQVQAFDKQDGHWYTQAAQDGPWTQRGKVTNPWTESPGFVPDGSGGGGGPPPGGGGGPPPGGPNGSSQYTKGISGEINGDLGFASLSIVPQYSSVSSDDNGQYQSSTDNNYYTVFTKMQERQSGVEARMTSAPDFFFKWILGFNQYKSNSARFTTYGADSPDTSSNGYNKASEDTHAFFANVTYPFTDKFRGSVGYRRSWDKMKNVEVPEMVAGGGTTGQNYSNPDYSLGVEYDLASNSMLYGTYATSYRVNAMRLPQSGHTVPPEKLKAYTVGAKNRFLENKLQLNVDAYYYDYKNRGSQVTGQGRINSTIPIMASYVTGPDGVTPYSDPKYLGQNVELGRENGTDPWVQQSGAFQTIGADISADWIITGKDKLNLSLAYINAKWIDTKIKFFWTNWTAAGTAATGNTGLVFSDNGKDLSGMKNTFSPTWTATLGYDHNFELGSLGTLLPHVDLMYKTNYILDYEEINSVVNKQEGYYNINANATFTHSSGIWTLNVYVKNATNYAAKNFWMNMSGSYTLGVSDPRTYGGVLSVKF